MRIRGLKVSLPRVRIAIGRMPRAPKPRIGMAHAEKSSFGGGYRVLRRTP